jgi:hypothetical protein
MAHPLNAFSFRRIWRRVGLLGGCASSQTVRTTFVNNITAVWNGGWVNTAHSMSSTPYYILMTSPSYPGYNALAGHRLRLWMFISD